MKRDENEYGPYLPPGTFVRYDGSEEAGPEYGVIVYCWPDDEYRWYDCYVAFFGRKMPNHVPENKPYVLRYLSTSLTVIQAETSFC